MTGERTKRTEVRLLMGTLIAAVFVSVLNSSMVNVSVPAIGEQFGASEAQVGWVITGYLLFYAVGIPLYGRASDLFSVRRTFLVGLITFGLGTLIGALAPSLLTLVIGRILQGAGAAAIPALASATVARVLPPGERGWALGLIFSSVGVGAAVGPVVGGIISQFWGWHALFFGSLLLTIPLLPAAWALLPDTAPQNSDGFDLLGGALLGLAAGLFLFGITEGQTMGFGSLASWGSFTGAAVAAAGFACRILTAPRPFASPQLFGNTRFVAALSTGFFSMLANVAILILTPLLLSSVNNLQPGTVGLVLAPGAAAVAVLSPYAGRLSDHIGMRIPILAGVSLMLLSVLFLSAVAGGPPLLLALGMLGLGAGFAIANSPTTNAAAAALEEKEVGVGLGIYQGIFFLGGGTGPALVGAFLAARQEAAAPALNPFYSLGAGAFSDAFLFTAAALVFSLIAAFGIAERGRDNHTPKSHSSQSDATIHSGKERSDG